MLGGISRTMMPEDHQPTDAPVAPRLAVDPAIQAVCTHFSMVLAHIQLVAEGDNAPIDENMFLAHFMGSGASSSLTYRDVKQFLDAMVDVLKGARDLKQLLHTTMTTALVWRRLPDLPDCPKINLCWSSVPVVVELADGSRRGAFFTYVGGDLVYPDDRADPRFQTDEGLAYDNVVRWALIPQKEKPECGPT